MQSVSLIEGDKSITTAIATKSVLIVEDEPQLLSLLGRTMKKAGVHVVLSGDGADALKKFDAVKPDLMLVDIIMPRLNGYDLIQQLRAKYGQSFKVVFITNLDNPKDSEMAHSLGIEDYIVKSDVSLRSLQQKVANIVSAL